MAKQTGAERVQRERAAGLLTGWPEIAAHLGVGTGAVKTWARMYALPVTRLLRGTVVTHRDALTEWWFRLARMERKMVAQGRLPGQGKSTRLAYLRMVGAAPPKGSSAPSE